MRREVQVKWQTLLSDFNQNRNRLTNVRETNMQIHLTVLDLCGRAMGGFLQLFVPNVSETVTCSLMQNEYKTSIKSSENKKYIYIYTVSFQLHDGIAIRRDKITLFWRRWTYELLLTCEYCPSKIQGKVYSLVLLPLPSSLSFTL
jgi:hypothetical protein